MLEKWFGYGWEHFHFLRPEWLWLLVPFFFVWLYQYRKQRRSDDWGNVIAPHLLKELKQEGNLKKLVSPTNFLALVSLIFIIISAGPTWKRQASPFEEDEAALYIALDVSDSMESKDVAPSRMERAKQKAQDLIALRPANKNALIVYAGSAHSVLPLTNDSEILKNYLRAIKVGITPRAGKAPETILPVIDKGLSELSVPATILLITDGIGSNTVKAFKQYFDNRDHQLLVLGVGKDAEGIAASGLEGVAPIDQTGLQRLVDETGGTFIEMTLDDEDARQINGRIASYMVTAAEDKVPWLDSGYYLIFLGLILFLPWFRKGWTLKWGILLFTLNFSTPAPVQAKEFIDYWMTPDQQGRYYFEKGEYKKAGQKFEDLMWKGTSYYMAEEFKLAAEYFSRVDGLQARFNQANAMAQAQSYLSAVKLYDVILNQDPEFPGAQNNRDICQAIVDEINRYSESQQDEKDDPTKSDELSEDAGERADGAEKKEYREQEVKQYSAEEILADEALNKQWMRNVEPNPSNFLRTKFSIQLAIEEYDQGSQQKSEETTQETQQEEN